MLGQDVSPITRMIVTSDGPMIDARMIASASQGTTSPKSVKRINSVS